MFEDANFFLSIPPTCTHFDKPTTIFTLFWLICLSFHVDVNRIKSKQIASKLEKAEILQLTVEHLKHLHSDG